LINADHRDRFGSTEDVDVWKYFVNPLPESNPRIQYQQKYIAWGYHEIKLPAGNWDIGGHLQSPKYFAHCMDTVRYYMRMKDEDPQDFVAIHWRAGDYTAGADSYHPRMEMDYYIQAMQQFNLGTKFMLFSDDIPAAKLMFGDRVKYSESQNYIEDFRLMKGAKGYICANSSFSALAAVLSEAPNKIMVFPKLWFGRVAGITGKDIYPPGAIVL
jgi:hypothetical protein